MQRLTATQQTVGTFTVLDRLGKPTRVQDPVWASSDEAVVKVNASADGKTVTVVAQGEGVAVVSLTGDADLGDGVKPIVGTEDFQVLPGEAVSVSLAFNAPEEQP